MTSLAAGWDPWPGVDGRVDTETVLRTALAGLRPEEREVLTLVAWEDLTVADAAHGTSTPLMRLAGYIKTHAGQPAGNATLILTTEAEAKGQPDRAASLYTDGGVLYWAHTESGLPAEIAAHHDIGNGMFRREVAAALCAVNGDLAIARQRMIDAPFAPGATGSAPSDASAAVTDNYVWANSLDALTFGAGNPQVRVGVLRLLSTLPEVTVTNTRTGGQPTLTLTTSRPMFPGRYREALTINASTGVPVAFAGGPPGRNRTSQLPTRSSG